MQKLLYNEPDWKNLRFNIGLAHNGRKNDHNPLLSLYHSNLFSSNFEGSNSEGHWAHATIWHCCYKLPAYIDTITASCLQWCSLLLAYNEWEQAKPKPSNYLIPHIMLVHYFLCLFIADDSQWQVKVHIHHMTHMQCRSAHNVNHHMQHSARACVPILTETQQLNEEFVSWQ